MMKWKGREKARDDHVILVKADVSFLLLYFVTFEYFIDFNGERNRVMDRLYYMYMNTINRRKSNMVDRIPVGYRIRTGYRSRDRYLPYQ